MIIKEIYMSIRSYRNFPEKKLTKSISRSTGRNNRGIITIGNRGGGHKQKYRFIEFRRSRLSQMSPRQPATLRDLGSASQPASRSASRPHEGEAARNLVAESSYLGRAQAIVQRIEYDPNRNAQIALISYPNGEKAYILHPFGLKVGTRILSHESAPVSIGNALPLQNLPLGVEVHCIELHPGKGGQLARAAGSLAQIIAKEGTSVTLRLPSGEIRFVNQRCWATVGQVGNIESINQKIGKAGRNRWLGKRPHVRGAAKNPVDHPHGGGEGRNGVGHKYPKTAYGKPALGKKTRKTKKYSDSYIVASCNK
jgi:large subunit ribosomal protein L2